MSSQLDFVEMTCDASPYEIVRACESIGFWAPLDVRWCRIDSDAPNRTGWGRRLWHHPWQTLLSLGPSSGPRCTCGWPHPRLRTFEFTFWGDKAVYRLGQCPWCRTMFWQEV